LAAVAGAPQLVDQPVARHDLIRVQQENRQHGALLAARERKLPPVVADLERAEDAEIHSLRVLVVGR
jgi:hypothetical protein